MSLFLSPGLAVLIWIFNSNNMCHVLCLLMASLSTLWYVKTKYELLPRICKEWAFHPELIGYLVSVRQQISQLIQRVPPLCLKAVLKMASGSKSYTWLMTQNTQGVEQKEFALFGSFLFFPCFFFFTALPRPRHLLSLSLFLVLSFSHLPYC